MAKTAATAPEATPIAHPWSHDALMAKTQRYAELMVSHAKDDWRFGLWSALMLELLLRASLSRVSPTLLAEKADWNNLYYALGNVPTVQKFVPKSIGAAEVATRLDAILTEFTPEMRSFCNLHMTTRNEELHTGSTPYDAQGTASWLPEFYVVCKALLTALDRDLAFLFGDAEALVAEEMITAFSDQSAKSVQRAIDASKETWTQKPAAERDTLGQQALVWASRHDGHRVICPACGSAAIVIGSPAGIPVRTMRDDTITEKQHCLPAKFECIACGLKIVGLSQLTAAGLGDGYTATSMYDVAELSGEPEFEDDFNEY